MKNLLVAIGVTILFATCGPDKTKTVSHGISDTTKNTPVLATDPPAKPNRQYPFHLTIHEGSDWNVRIDSIPENDFDQKKKVVYQEKKINGDSLLVHFAATYKDVIILTDSCCLLKGKDRDLTMCRRRPGDEKEWTGYDGIDYDHGYLILMEWRYESWNYVIFNPVTRQYTYTANEPYFIDNDLIYSAGNYYAEGQFQIINTRENKYYGFDFNWELTAFYKTEDSILLEFTLHNNKRYLKVGFK